MRRRNGKPANNKPETLSEMMDQMVPKRAINKTKAVLEEHNAKVETVPYYANKYGFNSNLIIFLPVGTKKDVVKAKFESRLVHKEINNFQPKKDMKV